MGKTATPAQFKKQFCERLRAARIAKPLEQAEFAEMLGLLPNTYSKYEKRSLLPHYLIAKACRILGKPVSYLYGESREKKGARGQDDADTAPSSERLRERARA